jgi:hypothetical protein
VILTPHLGTRAYRAYADAGLFACLRCEPLR